MHDVTLRIEQKELRRGHEAKLRLKWDGLGIMDVDAQKLDTRSVSFLQPVHDGRQFAAGRSQGRVEFQKLILPRRQIDRITGSCFDRLLAGRRG